MSRSLERTRSNLGRLSRSLERTKYDLMPVAKRSSRSLERPQLHFDPFYNRDLDALDLHSTPKTSRNLDWTEPNMMMSYPLGYHDPASLEFHDLAPKTILDPLRFDLQDDAPRTSSVLERIRPHELDPTLMDSFDLEPTSSAALDRTRFELEDLEERVARALERTRLELEPRTSGVLERLKMDQNGYKPSPFSSKRLGRSRKSLSRLQRSFDDIDLDYRPSRSLSLNRYRSASSRTSRSLERNPLGGRRLSRSLERTRFDSRPISSLKRNSHSLERNGLEPRIPTVPKPLLSATARSKTVFKSPKSVDTAATNSIHLDPDPKSASQVRTALNSFNKEP